MTESASSTSGQEFDVFSVMDWKDGVGTLPGSDLKFRVNEFGALEVITDESEMENVKKATATTTWMVPTAQEAPTSPPSSRPVFPPAYWTSPPGCPTVFSEKSGMPFRLKDPVKVEGIQFCENCCQYGNVDECLPGGNYCSQNCTRHIKDNRDQKEERDIGEDNEEEDPKCSRKKKPKLSLKVDSKEDGEEREDEMTVIPSGFRVGMKLEAVDKKNPAFICVATVTDMVDNRFLVHFDNWDESYDYWCEASSPHIHPVGWCKEHRRTLITPPGYPNVKHFSWDKYLEETNSLPAPARAFKVKPPHGFQKKMKLEIVDKRNPVFIRVATVADTDDHKIKVHFDGWNSCYDYWIDADSPDIHPVGWCSKTGHPLQPPLSKKHMDTKVAANCPYSEINLNKDRIFPDRLSGEMPPASPSFPRNKRTDTNEISSSPEIRDQHADDVKEDFEERTESEMRTSHEARGAREEPAVPQAQRRSAVFLSFKSPIPCLPLRWEQQSKLLPTVAGIPASKVSKWSTDEVSEFIQSLPGCEEHGKVFKDEQIDGEAFLLMTQTDIVKIMSIKLGPALKIFNSILMFKAAEKNSHNEL
ncbi:PREDICTED: lethal(3)malignant brain tumor-like protein 3 [Hipposideros armiger]|uniref:Lethal(3)malignant brain tumor-like protein 3 n=1 Tax=Hipposideros armiger TaxID=186990 RepID=A0A8B7Q8S9_HIPAR|nr:PREDICTED: lethal(3)malignant brain tumor-like protein 3 [Hipposideros armiger]